MILAPERGICYSFGFLFIFLLNDSGKEGNRAYSPNLKRIVTYAITKFY